MTPEQQARTQKKVPDHICARCRKPFEIGERVQMVYILCNPHARNPDNITQQGLELGTDCEFAHADCRDPFLNGRIVLP